MQAMTPITPLEPGVEMFERAKTQSLLAEAVSARTSLTRPVSQYSEFTDFEDDNSSEFEEYMNSSSENRRSQTTISTFEEVQTPQDALSPRFQFSRDWYLQKPVEGPKGPHLFRASTASNDFNYDYALQLSPMLPKEPMERSLTAFRIDSAVREDTPATVVPRQEYNNIASAVSHLDNAEVRAWTSRDVATWMYQNGFDADIIDKFEMHDITGAVLLDLQFDDLKELEIQSFGKRHRLWNQIDSLRTVDGLISPTGPAPTPFEDISRPCTAAREKSKSRTREKRNRSKSKKRHNPEGNECEGDETKTPITPGGAGRRRGRRNHRLGDDIITPAESVSIVAIEQLLPKPHKCKRGERCAKWRKQQRQLARLQEEHGFPNFPISPEKGGHIFIAGDPGNAHVAQRVVENVYKPTDDDYRPTSDAIPSVVASSDVLGPGQLPEFTLQEDLLQKLDLRDPQDNVRQFLTLQGVDNPYATATPIERPATPPMDMFPAQPQVSQPYLHPATAPFKSSFSPSTVAPSTVPTPALYPPSSAPVPHNNLRMLPKLNIPPPRSMSCQPQLNHPTSAVAPPSAATVTSLHGPGVAPETTFSPCRTASPGGVYRFGTPFSEMDAPVTAIPAEPLSRDTSQSVPPNMQYRDPVQRAGSRMDWRRPSLGPLPALNEDQVFSPHQQHPPQRHLDDNTTLAETQFSDDEQRSPMSEGKSPRSMHSTRTPKAGFNAGGMAGVGSGKPMGGFDYGSVNHHGWMKKRRTRLLRHEWQDHHFRLQGTKLAMHENELPSTSALQTIDVDDYAVACSSIASNKLSAKLRALRLTSSSSSGEGKGKGGMPAAFEFQLVPTKSDGAQMIRKVKPDGKVHHFAVKTRDERIDWMRELMLAKALKAKGEGYEVTVNGNPVG